MQSRMLKFQLCVELFYISLDMDIIFLCVIFSSNFFIFKESARVSHSSTTKVTALKKTSWTMAVIRRSVLVLELKEPRKEL